MQIFPKFYKRRCLPQLPPPVGSPPSDTANSPDYNRLSAALQAYHQLHPPVWRLISMSAGCADNHHFAPSESRLLSLPGVEAQLSLWSLFLLLVFAVVTTFPWYCSLSPEPSTCGTRREVTQGVAQINTVAAAAAMRDLVHNHPLGASMSLIRLAR